MEGVFVTGTGTEVGKTVVAGLLARTARRKGLSVAVFKPAVSGLSEDGPPDHERLRRAAGSHQTDEEIAPYRYEPPVSPHLAAEMAGEPIDVGRLREGLAAARSAGEFLVCEGVGGFLVPLRTDYLVRDFARDCGLPVVIVASTGLGTINHTLLTVESVRAAGLDVRTVALTPWPDRPSAVEVSNRETIGRLGEVEVRTVGVVDPDDPDSWPELSL